VALRAVVRDDCSSSGATDLAAVVAELVVAVFLSVCVKVDFAFSLSPVPFALLRLHTLVALGKS
jgi:hypothetical protein